MAKEMILYYAFNGSIERQAARNFDTLNDLARRWHMKPNTIKRMMRGKPVRATTAKKVRDLVAADNPYDADIFYARARKDNNE